MLSHRIISTKSEQYMLKDSYVLLEEIFSNFSASSDPEQINGYLPVTFTKNNKSELFALILPLLQIRALPK